MKGTIKELAKYRINIFPGVNTLFNGLGQPARLRQARFLGSSPSPTAAAWRCRRRWRRSGSPSPAARSSKGYGLSETSAGVTCNPTDSSEYTGTIGLPLPNVEIKILDDQGKEVRWARPARSPSRARRSCRATGSGPDETRMVMTPDGFFKSGDVGEMDARGYIKIVDRKKDMIVVSGFKVFPNEIEAWWPAIPACSSAPRSACPTRARARPSCCSSSGATRA
jgi:long-chain acyl-CoA synthetase